MITNLTQVQKDLQSLESAVNNTTLALAAAGIALNISHKALWSLPEDRLTAVLQELHDRGELQNVFNLHYTAATGINGLLNAVGHDGNRCIDQVGRTFTITNDVVTLDPLPDPSGPV